MTVVIFALGAYALASCGIAVTALVFGVRRKPLKDAALTLGVMYAVAAAVGLMPLAGAMIDITETHGQEALPILALAFATIGGVGLPLAYGLGRLASRAFRSKPKDV